MIITKNILPVTQVKRDLMKILRELGHTQESIVITKDGHAAGVLLSIEEYDGLQETREIKADPQLMRDINRSRQYFKRGGKAKSYKDIDWS